ncbi:MAG: hypothetical protein ABSE57_31840 [Bryobacteraceae bacterium]
MAVPLPEPEVTAKAKVLALAPGIYPVAGMFTSTPYDPSLPGNGWTNNFDGNELWPCEGSGGENPDCPTIGNPAISSYGLTIGAPFYIHSLSACDGTTNGTQVPYTWDQGGTVFPYSINGYYVPCGQILSIVQNLTNDTTDDYLVSMVVKQGGSVIADTGIQDYGLFQLPPGFTADQTFVMGYQDFNFGALGVAGPDNGNCAPNSNYPASSFPVTASFFSIASGHTCVDPVAGPATITVRNSLATPTWTCKDAKGVASCTVKYKEKYSLVQEWNIYLM